MTKTDRIYKVLRSNLTTQQAQEVAKHLEVRIPDVTLNHIEQAITSAKSNSSAVARVEKKIDPDALRLASMFSGYVLARYPYYASKFDIQKTAEQIQLIVRRDGATYMVVEALMKYLFEHYEPKGDFDWREQIRSGVKLRKHFIQIFELAKKEGQARQVETIG